MRSSLTISASIFMLLLLSGCGSSPSSQIETSIDAASDRLKQEVRKIGIDKEFSDLNKSVDKVRDNVVNDPELKNLGIKVRDGLKDATGQLDQWLDKPATR